MMKDPRQLPEGRRRARPWRNTVDLVPTSRAPVQVDLEAGSEPRTALDYWRVIRARKTGILLTALVVCLVAYLMSVRQKPIYRAGTSLEIEQINGDFLNLKEVFPTSNTSLAETFVRTQMQILQSNALVARVVDRMRLAERSEFAQQPGLISSLLVFLGLRSRPAIPAEISARQWALEHLTARQSMETNIVEVLFDAPEPQLAADFANNLAEEFIQQNLETRWRATQHTSEWLTNHLEDLKTKLEQSEEELLGYARDAGLLYTAEQYSVAEEKLRQLQEQHTEAQKDRIEKQSFYERSLSSPAESLPAVLEDTTLRAHVGTLAELRRRVAELRASFKPTFYKVQQVEAQTAELEATLEREKKNILLRIQNEYESAQRRERLLSSSYNDQAQVVAEQAVKGVHYEILRRGVETTREIYAATLQRMKEAGVASALRASNIRVVDIAEPPVEPFKPTPLFNATIGLLCGTFFGAAFVVVREVSDQSLRVPGDVTLRLNLPALGEIPSSHSNLTRAVSRKAQLIRFLESVGVQARVIARPSGTARTGRRGADRPLDEEPIRVFLAAWWRRFRERRVGLMELWDLAREETAGIIDLGDDEDWRRKASLGKFLKSLSRRRYELEDGRTVRVTVGSGANRARHWRLVQAGRSRSQQTETKSRERTSNYFRPRRIVVKYRYRTRNAAQNGEASRSVDPTAERLELATWYQQHTLLAEAFHNTATSIQLCRDSRRLPKTIVLTSPNPMEGKTTVICNLAIALADRGARVLLVDGDLRQPRLHQVFNTPNQRGLCALLTSSRPIGEIPREDLTTKTSIPSLQLLPSGCCDSSIPNMLSSSRMHSLIQRLRGEFDSILIDTPPMLHLSDARILSKLADGVILVFRAGKTTTEAAARALRSFHQDGTTVLGAILNDLDVRSLDDDWYLYPSYYYPTVRSERAQSQ